MACWELTTAQDGSMGAPESTQALRLWAAAAAV